MSFTFLNELPSPAEIKQNYPLSDKLKALKKERDAAISAVITGADSRFLVIIGPCSADNEDSVCDYVSRLTSIQEDVADKLILIPRVYTNKPRTTGEGYKGIASQPDPEKAPDMIEGLIAMRKMHIRAIEESGLTCADEMLYPENWGYVEDLLSYVAIGARSVEDQQHRLTVSGFDVASGMKNPTSGDFSVMLNSVYAAQHPHHFVYRGYEVETTGNPLTHVVLRGAVSKHGNTTQNYHYEDLIRLCEMYQKMDSLKALLHFETWPPKAGVKPYDPFNPTARDMYWAEMKKNIFDLGMDGWWLDSTEPDHLEIKDKDFDTPTYLGSFRRVHNAFPLMSNKGVYEHQRATTSDKRVFLLTRSSFLGQQRYASHSWSGDVVSTWEVMKKQLAAGLNYSLCGIPYWNTDLGGFFAWKYNNNVHNIAYHELHVRWYQWGAFQPIMRSHNSSPVAVEIYQFGKKGDWAYDALEKYTHLRYRLLPYLYSTSWEVTNKAGSIIRPLMMDFPKDKKVLEMDTEYMFGRNFLVRPVTDSLYTWQDDKQNGYQKNMNKIGKTDVYLPAGAQWIDFWTGKSLKGGQTIQREVPIDIMPVYVRAGSILPWGPAVQYSTEKKWDNLTLRIYPGADAEFTLYEDEFDNYNYEKGAYTTIAMKWNDKDRTLTINDRQGNYKGMLKNRKFNIIIVEPGKGCGDGDATTFDQSVSYRGKRVDLKL